MTTYTHLSLRAATVLAGGIAAFGGLFMATPAFADYGSYYYPPQGTAGLGNVCDSRFDPFCMQKEGNYLNYESQYYSPYSYGNYGYGYPNSGYSYPYNYSYPSYNYGYTSPSVYSYSNSYQNSYQYCYGTGCAQPMNYSYNNYQQPMNGYNSYPYNYGY